MKEMKNVKDSMAASLVEGNERVTLYKEHIKSETSAISNVKKHHDLLAIKHDQMESELRRFVEENELLKKQIEFQNENHKMALDQNKKYVEQLEQAKNALMKD